MPHHLCLHMVVRRECMHYAYQRLQQHLSVLALKISVRLAMRASLVLIALLICLLAATAVTWLSVVYIQQLEATTSVSSS